MARPAKPAAVETNEAPATPVVTNGPPPGYVRVCTTGPFMLIDLTTGTHIEADVPVDVPDSSFIRDRIELKQLEIVG